MMYILKSTPAVEHSDSLDASEQMDCSFPKAVTVASLHTSLWAEKVPVKLV